jgi:hypothetical protein
MTEVQIVLQPRNETIAELIAKNVAGELPFDGPDSLCSKVAAMGFKTTSLFEMVMAAKAERKS